MKKSNIMIGLVLSTLFFLSGCSEQASEDLESDKSAVVEGNDSEQATVPQETEVMDTESNSEISVEIQEYVTKIVQIQVTFLGVLTKEEKTKEDIELLQALTDEADFTPPQGVTDMHELYKVFLASNTNSIILFEKSKTSSSAEDIEKSVTEMEKASLAFSEFNEQFNYYLEEQGIDKNLVGWTF